jgi:hypothetical protein
VAKKSQTVRHVIRNDGGHRFESCLRHQSSFKEDFHKLLKSNKKSSTIRPEITG